MKMKKILAAVMAAALLTGTLAMGGCSSDSGKLVMVTEAGFAPYEYYDGEAVVGVDVDIAKEIAAAMGKELEVRDIAFDSLINEVQSGKADFAAAGLSVTPEREEQVDFTINYATSKQVIVVRQDNTEITGPDDVNGKTVSVQLGTVADTAVSDKEDYPDCTVIQQKKYLAVNVAVLLKTLVDFAHFGHLFDTIILNFFNRTARFFHNRKDNVNRIVFVVAVFQPHTGKRRNLLKAVIGNDVFADGNNSVFLGVDMRNLLDVHFQFAVKLIHAGNLSENRPPLPYVPS